MNAPALIDSGAFIALLDASDHSHHDVRALFAAPPRRLYTSVLVVAETHGWFLKRHGETAARAFLALLVEAPNLTLLGADARHHAAVRAKLETLRGHKLSYVDASCLVQLKAMRLGVVWGCDHDLTVEGARVLPGPPLR